MGVGLVPFNAHLLRACIDALELCFDEFIFIRFLFSSEHLLGARRALRLAPPMERRACHVGRRKDPVCNGRRVRAELEK